MTRESSGAVCSRVTSLHQRREYEHEEESLWWSHTEERLHTPAHFCHFPVNVCSLNHHKYQSRFSSGHHQSWTRSSPLWTASTWVLLSKVCKWRILNHSLFYPISDYCCTCHNCHRSRRRTKTGHTSEWNRNWTCSTYLLQQQQLPIASCRLEPEHSEYTNTRSGWWITAEMITQFSKHFCNKSGNRNSSFILLNGPPEPWETIL